MNSDDEILFSTQRESEEFVGWKLYFLENSFKDSHELIKNVQAAQKHFSTHSHWYNINKIKESWVLNLKPELLEQDKDFLHEWPQFYENFELQPTKSLACFALAMHNIIIASEHHDEYDSFRYKKIYTRPIRFKPVMKMTDVYNNIGKLITIAGTVIIVEQPKVFLKIICFKCITCRAEVQVKQHTQSQHYIYPSSCEAGCKTKGRFKPLLSHHLTMFHSKQIVRVQEEAYVSQQDRKVIKVALSRELAESVITGNFAAFTGIFKHEMQKPSKFAKKRESQLLEPYLKCVSIKLYTGNLLQGSQHIINKDDFLDKMSAEPSPFRLLVRSLCPSYYGREEIKSGLVLCLLSGDGLLQTIRSNTHILLVGSPATGKSQLLTACIEASKKGIYVNGPTSTGVGLTGSVGENGTINAGALMLADQGICCIDEFDKIGPTTDFMLETMEQQTVSIAKCGVQISSTARTCVIAAANPKGSFYDNTKTIGENVRISKPLMSRFDLIFALRSNEGNQDEKYFKHLKSREAEEKSSGSNNLFRNNKNNEDKQELPMQLLQLYIEHARKTVKPTLSKEASNEITKFFKQLRGLKQGKQMQTVTFRLLEGLMRLTLSRARADLRTVATRDDAMEMIQLMKFSMIDNFECGNPSQSGNNASTRSGATTLSTQSKPKQLKAFLERLNDIADKEQRDEFTTVELREIAKELGIRDFYDIIDTLNNNAAIIQRVGGYKLM